MKLLLLLAAALCASAASNPLSAIRALSQHARATNVWAVLVAGSHTYDNYRHQADVCAYYQQLRAMDVPEEKIIVMMYDDIAQNRKNHRKGEIINTPGGPDVYKGVPKDYTGKLVTPKALLSILKGEAPAGGSGKKLGSTSNDHVFFYFADHGGIGHLEFPSDSLSGKELHAAIVTMNEMNMFGSMYVAIEACESGSVFYKYEYPKNVYIVTAAPVSYSSYAWQWDDTVNAYVSDVWSWYMLDYLVQGHESSTLHDQFDYTESMMSNWSQPCEYGDLDTGTKETIRHFFYQQNKSASGRALPFGSDAVRAWDVSLETARRLHAKYGTTETAEKLKVELHVHHVVDAMKARLLASVQRNDDDKDLCVTAIPEMECAQALAVTFKESCGKAHDYLDSVSKTIFSICRATVDVSKYSDVIRSECAKLHF